MLGIDLSNNNSTFADWSGVEFAFLKVTESTTFVDMWFSHFRDQAAARNIPWSGYHFAHPDVNTADDEAAFFLRYLAPIPDLACALDVESRTNHDPLAIMGAPALGAWINRWCMLVRVATGLWPYVYLNRYYLSALAPYLDVRLSIWLATLDGSKPTTYAGRAIAIVQYLDDGIDHDESLIALTSQGDHKMPAPLVVLDDGAIVALPSDGGRPWHVLDPTMLNIELFAGCFGPVPSTALNAEQSASVRANMIKPDATSSASAANAPTKFTGTVELTAAP